MYKYFQQYRNFHRIWIVMENVIVKCPDLDFNHIKFITDTFNGLTQHYSIAHALVMPHFYTLSHENNVARNRYLWLLFPFEDQPCNNLRIQCTRTINEYDLKVPMPCIRMMSQINCVDVTMLSQKRLPLATMGKWVITDCFSGFVSSAYQISV